MPEQLAFSQWDRVDLFPLNKFDKLLQIDPVSQQDQSLYPIAELTFDWSSKGDLLHRPLQFPLAPLQKIASIHFCWRVAVSRVWHFR